MEYKVDDIVKAVREILDWNEAGSDTLKLTDVGTLDIDTAIKSQIDSAAQVLEMVAPTEYADWTECKSQYITEKVKDNSVSYMLPEGYLRFGHVKLAEWNYPVKEFVDTQSKEYKRQWGEFDELKATTDRPVVAMIDGYNGKAVTVQCFGVDEDATSHLESMSLVIKPAVKDVVVTTTEGTTTYSAIDINKVLCRPLDYMVASLVCEMLKDSTKAGEMQAVAKNLLTSGDAVASMAMAQQAQPQEG